VKIIQFLIKENGFFPNNAALPVLLYKGALHLPEEDKEDLVKEVFEQNGWSNAWTDGIYDYHHYHSITHEVLGVIQGECTIMLGGERGIKQKLQVGDVIVLPAGIAHKNIESSKNFTCVGAYPGGTDYDMNYGKEEEYPKVKENIKNVPVPSTDPLYGKEGPLLDNWTKKAILIHHKNDKYANKTRRNDHP
jgi:uncharacterized protein YjlB